jgi:LssY C-terminus
VFWILVTYLVLPRLHRILTRIYVPGYFIGRARTSDGLLGDPINLALVGDEAQVHLAMAQAGWIRADELSLTSGLQIVRSTLRRRSYTKAPVSPLLLFDRQQDFAYQQEVAGSPSKRHHVRFWRAPDGWMLPGGYSVGWLAAGTYDRSVGLSLFTLQITHKIEANTDIERDYITNTITNNNPEMVVEVIRDFSTGYHSRNGGGDLIQTDGDLPIIDVRRIDAPSPSALKRTDSRDKRPAQIVFGATVSFLRASLFMLVGLVLIVVPPEVLARIGAEAEPRGGLIIAGVVLIVIAFGDISLALAVMFGRNWARILLMLFSAVAIITAFINNADRSEVITLGALPTVGISILVLLALSSHRARNYATRGRNIDSGPARHPARPQEAPA